MNINLLLPYTSFILIRKRNQKQYFAETGFIIAVKWHTNYFLVCGNKFDESWTQGKMNFLCFWSGLALLIANKRLVSSLYCWNVHYTAKIKDLTFALLNYNKKEAIFASESAEGNKTRNLLRYGMALFSAS